MSATYSIRIDARRDLVHVTMAGFFRTDDVARFGAELRAAQQALRCGANQHFTLVDVSAMDIQSQDRIAEFQTLMSDPQYKGKRIAFVVAHTLARLQAKRAAQGRNAEFFATEGDATAWLFQKPALAA